MQDAVIYVRVSSQEQVEEGYSLAAQEARLRSYCDLHDLGSPHVFADPGYSGGNMERPGVQELIREVQAGKVSHVLVWRLDRLSRSLKDILYLAELFQKHSVAFISFSENFDTTTASGRLFFNITGVFAQFYRDQLSENVRMGMQQAAKEGRWINRPPTGYDLKEGVLVPNDDAYKITRAFELAAKRNLSLHEVARKTGLKSSHIRQVLGNRAYLGEVRLRDKWFAGKHKALIDIDTFNGVQEIRKPYIRMWHNRTKHYLSGYIYCGICKRALSISYPANGNRGAVYTCRHRTGNCPGIGYRSKSVVEKGICMALEATKKDKHLLSAIKKELRSGHDNYLKESNKRLVGIDKEIRAIGIKKKKLLEAIYKGIDFDFVRDEQKGLEVQIEILRAERENVLKLLSEKKEAIVDFDSFMEVFQRTSIADIWNNTSEEEKQIILSEYFEQIEIYRNRLTTKLFNMLPISCSWEDIKDVRISTSVGGGFSVDMRT